MNTHTTTANDEPTRYPDAVSDGDDPSDQRQMAPDADERDPEEAGYGYGV